MNKQQILSLFEFVRGITNFVLSIVLVLSIAEGDFNFLPVFILGLILANFSLLKERLTRKNIFHKIS
jgi:hypothetical protein